MFSNAVCTCIVSLLLNILSLYEAKHIEIPSNFYGSSEVFSGYLSEQQQYIDAFSLHPDHVLISGTIKDVEYGLERTQETGICKKYLNEIHMPFTIC